MDRIDLNKESLQKKYFLNNC